MDDWIKLLGLVFGASVITIVVPIVWRSYGTYRKWQKEIQNTQAIALTSLETQRDDYRQQISELKQDLREKQRALETKDDFSRQDRAHIRLLKIRLQDRNIDFDDIEEQIRRFFNDDRK